MRAMAPATAESQGQVQDQVQGEVQLRRGNGVADRVLSWLLFATILISPFVFIEPSPYEALVGLLALGAISAGISLDRSVLPLLILLLLWTVGGAFSLMPVVDDSKSVMFLLVSVYLQMSAVLFACLFREDTVARLSILRTAYVLAAALTALIGILAYFKAIPAADMFVVNGRASGTFKDPNVFAPFLILPLLFLIQAILDQGPRPRYLMASLVILLGLFLSFSRGAWGHFALSAALMLALMFITTHSARFRARLIGFTAVSIFALAGLLAVVVSFSAVGDMFAERASLVQSYDAGESGRFGRQATSLHELLERPNGVGPLQFGKHFGHDAHNQYLNTFFSYGWLGGSAYLTVVVLTLVVGFRALLVRTPWQPTLIATYATFVGLAAESAIIDTDHWRHYYLVLGVIWGLVAATEKARRTKSGNAVSAAPRVDVPSTR